MTIKPYLPSTSTLKHLRFNFSIYLTPIFFFALCGGGIISIEKAALLFLILTLGIFPASNGYNSYYDKDEGSIGGLENPPIVSKNLLYYSCGIELFAILSAALFFSWKVALLFFTYGLFSKLYSHPSVRLKKMPFIGFLTVSFFQGAVIYLITRMACADVLGERFDTESYISSLFLGASYPLTQIYQHEEDKMRGDQTISLLLGLRGTFIFSGVFFFLSGLLLWSSWGLGKPLFIFLSAGIPGSLYLMNWARITWNNPAEANFKNTHRFMKISSLSAIAGFLLIFSLDAFSYEQVGYSTLQLNGKPWFELHSKEENGVATIIFKNDSGILSEEKVISKEGKVVNYSWSQLQTGQKIEIARSDSTLLITEDGKTKKIKLSKEESELLLFPPMLSQFLSEKVRKDPKISQIPLFIIAPDKALVLKFQFNKIKNAEWILKADSFFVRLVVPEITFLLNDNYDVSAIRRITPPVKFPLKDRLENRETEIVIKEKKS